MKIGFSAEKYIEEQSKYIRERINSGNSERLYLEFGGNLCRTNMRQGCFPVLTKTQR